MYDKVWDFLFQIRLSYCFYVNQNLSLEKENYN